MSLANYGTAIANSFYGRLFFQNESDQDLTVQHVQNGTISLLTTGANSMVKIGGSTAAAQIQIVEGTVTSSYASSSTITDGVSTLKNGLFTGLKSVTSTTITDGTMQMKAGSITGALTIDAVVGSFTTMYGDGSGLTGVVAAGGSAKSLTSNNTYINVDDNGGSDGFLKFATENVERMRIINNGNVGIGVTNPSKTLEVNGMGLIYSITDNVATLQAGSFTNVNVVYSNTLTDKVATLTGGTFTNLKSVTSNTFTDGVASLNNGTFSALRSVTSNTFTDGTAILQGGLFTGLNLVTTTTLTDGTGTLLEGNLTGLKSVTSVTLTDGSLVIQNSSITGGGFIYSATITAGAKLTGLTITDNVANLENGLFTGLKSVTSSSFTDGIATLTNGTFTNLRSVTSNTLTDGIALLYEASLTGAIFVDTDIASVTKIIQASSITDNVATLRAGSFTDLLHVASQLGSITKTLYASTITDNVSSLSGGIFLGLKSVNSSSFTDGIATLTNGTFTNLRSVTSNTLTDGIALLYEASLTGAIFVDTDIASVTKIIQASSITDNVATLRAGSFTDLLHVASQLGSITKTLYASTITDNVSSLSGGIFLGLKSVNSSSFTDGVATLTNGTFTNLRSVTSNTLTDGVALLYEGSLTSMRFIDSQVASVTVTLTAGTVSSGEITDGVITVKDGTISCTGDTGFIEANIGSFTNLYANDLFVADDMVVNGTTTYVNTSQTSFEDELISLGASDGRSVASVSGSVVYLETDATAAYTGSSYVLCMQTNGTKEIIGVASYSTNAVTLDSAPNASTTYIALISTEAVADGAGVEMLAHNGSGASRIKTLHYVNGSKSMEVISEGDSLDLRVSNANAVSYFGVNDNSTHKKLLTSDALYLNLTATGSITGGSEPVAIYMSKNGGGSDANGDWRTKISGSGTSQTLVYEQYNGSSWITRWQLD